MDMLQNPGQLVVALVVAYILKSVLESFFRRSDLPPFYSEAGYIPWLGSLVQFATGPRKFLQRAALAKGDVFTIQLFGKSMTFLTGSAGHEHFFKQREHVFDIREAYAMTVITFGPGVCYDCPQSKMAQQFAFFKNGLSDESFVKYMELVQDEVATFFEQEWGDEGEADLLKSLSDLYTLTSSRCLLGDEIRQLWKASGMAEHYCKCFLRAWKGPTTTGM
jgi:sterol 14-demethylase